MADFDKPSNNEDDYFAREDLEKKRKLALEQSRATADAEKERLKQLHWMHCPKCGMQLQTVKQGNVEIDSCFNCGGVFFDKGELEALIANREQTAPVVEAVLNWFKKK